MTKRKRRRRPQGRRAQRPAALRQEGMRYFKRTHYERAISIWEQIGQTAPDALPKVELAEAYFRRAMERLHAQERGLTPDLAAIDADLRRAVTLLPNDGLYVYHLGLVQHRQGDLKAAVATYRKALGLDKALAQRMAYPLALALLQTGEDPTQDALWTKLRPEQQLRLTEVSVFRRRPYQVDEKAPLLWQGIAAVDCGEQEQAQSLFAQILESATTSSDIATAHYYLGVIAAQQEDWHETRREWSKAALKGGRTPVLDANLGELYHRLAEEHLLAEDVVAAEEATNEAVRYLPDDKRLKITRSQIYQRLGYQHAMSGNWDEALTYWQEAYNLENGSFRMAYNLALLHEKTEDFLSAAGLWREALRRRPRKDNHPDAISNEQVAKLWRRAAEAYLRAEEFEEAINVYKLAVKWNPDHLETRIALVEGYINDGRFTAAQNELQRILDKDADYVPALLRMGEIALQNEYWWYARAAEEYFNRVLELEPDNAAARQGLSDFYMLQGDNIWQWQGVENALPLYEKALALQPQNGTILLAVGGCYLDMGETEKGHAYLDDALKYGQGNMQVYLELLQVWLWHGDNDKADEIMNRIKTESPDAPFQVYLLPVIYCVQNGQTDLARHWIEKLIAEAPPEEHIMSTIGEMLTMSPAPDLAEEYLQRAIAANERPGWMYISLCTLALRKNDRIAAQRYLDEARAIAKKTHDHELSQQIIHTQGLFDMPPFFINMALSDPNFLNSVISGDPSGMFGPGFMPDMDDYDDDDDYYDDEGYDDGFNIFGI